MLEERARIIPELTYRAALHDALNASVALIDDSGEIVSVNSQWQDAARRVGCSAAAFGEGRSYFDVCRSVMEAADAQEAVRGVREVIDGTRAFFYYEYPTGAFDETGGWSALRTSPLLDRPNCFAVSHEDITDRVARERKRLRALRRTGLLNSLPDTEIDDIVSRTKRMLSTPIALFTLLDERRQWFKARAGLSLTETARSVSFCAHAIGDDEPLIVPDASKDFRFEHNRLVTHEPRIRFYAGVPVHERSGLPIGTLCVIDHYPRQFADADRHLLEQMAAEIEQRVQSLETH